MPDQPDDSSGSALLEPDASRAASPPPPSPPQLSPWVTAVCAVFAGGYLAFALATTSLSPLDRLEFPEESLERLASREMDLREALRLAPDWKRTLYTAFSGTEDSLADAIEWYDELVSMGASPQAQLYRVVLEAEAGQANRVSTVLVPWEFQGESPFRMAQWVRAAYLRSDLDSEMARVLLVEIRTELPTGWFADILTARIAGRLGDAGIKKEAEAAVAARGDALLDRWIALIIGQMTVLVLGLIMLARLVGVGDRGNPLAGAGAGPPSTTMVSNAPLPPPWPARDGYSLFIRGVFGFILAGLVSATLLPKESLYNGIGTLVAGAPLLWWLARYLKVRGLSMSEVFGLKPAPGGIARLGGVTLAVVGLSVLGEIAINLASEAFHIKPHWADGLIENMLWGPPWVVVGETLDSVVWAPLIEEIAFRGLLYATLRMSVGMWPAVGISALLFALVHGYGAIGFASVLWSGMLWAVAYERSRSLLPAMLAHMINNLLVSAEFLWLLRF